jgi:cathepsin B
MNYKSGIYKYTSGELIGGHAMKVIGYGTDNIEGLYWVM